VRFCALTVSLSVACGTPDPAAVPGADASADALLPDGTIEGASDAASACSAAWGKLDVANVVDPMDFGAVGDGKANDLPALDSAVKALPPKGGIVFFPAGKTFRKTDLLEIGTPHVKLWSVNRSGGIFGAVLGVRRRQSILCKADGCGVFGLALGSDASARFDALEDNQISVDHVADAEVVGVEISSSAAAGIFLYGAQRTFIEGNWIHHTWADHVHHTDGARTSFCWGNYIFNEPPSKGDDGIACVTYGVASPKCGDMEWWSNVILGSGWGRGYSVIGGDHVSIHDNWAMNVAGAGIIVASESSYDSASSNDVVARKNYLYRSGQVIGHPGILVSGGNSSAPALTNIAFEDEVSAETKNGQAYRTEGKLGVVTNTGMSDQTASLPKPMPTKSDAKPRDTSILATRDSSWVTDAAQRRGLHRIHVRKATNGYEQRFEYVVHGAPADVAAFVGTVSCVVESRVVAKTAWALVLSPKPLTVPSSLAGATFAELRAGDRDGTLRWLWARIDAKKYD
jgi:hypothetical protein